MALSKSAVDKAYKVFNELKQLIPLNIPTWPEDMYQWEQSKKDDPPLNKVLGWDRKNDGWENIFFFVKNPSEKLKARFNELKDTVPNSSMCSVYKDHNPEVWIMGWF